MASKTLWKEIAIGLAILGFIYFIIQLTAPFLAINFWDAVRNVFGLG